MLLHQIRIKEREKIKDGKKTNKEFKYLDDDKEVDILEKIYSKLLIERKSIIFMIILAIVSYYTGYFGNNRNNQIFNTTYYVITGVIIISILQTLKNWWNCRKNIDECEFGRGYLNWLCFKRIVKVSVMGLYIYSILLFALYRVEGSIGISTLPEGVVCFLIASFITIIGLILGIVTNTTRNKLIEVAFENMSEGIKKGQLDTAKESLEEEAKVRMLWGEGYTIAYKQCEVLINKIEQLAKEEEASLIDRTELITNASHDIRTPLTSIINYIDILNNEDISKEEREDFIKILESKTDRLKALIDDLKYATSFSIGDIEANREEVDVVELLNLALEESKDSLENINLNIIKNINEDKAICRIDRNNTMRVLQNLLSNISKYSLEGSRVYISLDIIDVKDSKYKEKECKIILKNISRDKLNIDPQELMKRFKRGDESRNISGHGLGLDIANNLMKLQKSKINIDIQGDLFKVELLMPLKETYLKYNE
ncbi:MAG: sensor histidine kinase [Clostridium sp.]